jgi:hypothetical protein
MNCPETAAGWVDYTLQTWYALLNSGFVLAPSAGTANGVHPVPLGYDRVYVKIDGPFSYEKGVVQDYGDQAAGRAQNCSQ